MIIRYSLINAIILFNLAMVIVALLRRKTAYLARYTTAGLLFLLLIATIRVFIPISIPDFTFIIRSYEIIPYIESILRIDMMPGSGTFEIQYLLLITWAAGIVIMSLKVLRRFQRLNSIQSTYHINDSTRETEIAQSLCMKRTTVIVSPDVQIPYVTGVFKAKIYLPPLNLPDEKLEMVLRHEYQHFKRGDALIKSFYVFLSILFWWNPFIHIFIRDLNSVLEIRCDATMTKRMSHEQKATYLDTLIDIYRDNRKSTEPIATSSLYQAGTEKLITQRFKLLTSNKKSVVGQLFSVLLVAVLFLTSYMIIIQPAYDIPYEYMEDVFFISPENAVIVLTPDGIYRVYIDNQFFGELTEIVDPFTDLPIIEEER